MRSKWSSLLCALVVLLSGCSGTREVLVSRPTDSTSAVTRDGRLDDENFLLYVRPTNHIVVASGVTVVGFTDLEPVDPNRYGWFSPYYLGKDGFFSKLSAVHGEFYVEILVSAKHQVAVRPVDIFLVTEEGKIIRPEGYLGPLKTNSTANYSLSLCKPIDRKQDFRNDLSVAPIILSPGNAACVALKYPVTPPRQNVKFGLLVSGITVDGRSIKVPELIFNTDRYVVHHP